MRQNKFFQKNIEETYKIILVFNIETKQLGKTCGSDAQCWMFSRNFDMLYIELDKFQIKSIEYNNVFI